jgi:hypothetical protein
MRFQVPQFIEIEDKILGPFTIKQFIYLAGGAGICIALWRFVPYFILKLVFVIPAGAFALMLAFYPINGKPFIFTVEAAIRYVFTSIPREEQERQELGSLIVPKLSDSKLKDLTWSLDINEITSPGAKESMSGK